MLSAFVASGYATLVPVLPEQVSLTRSLHMHIHEDHRRTTHVKEVAAFIAAEVERDRSLFEAPTAPTVASREDTHQNERRQLNRPPHRFLEQPGPLGAGRHALVVDRVEPAERLGDRQHFASSAVNRDDVQCRLLSMSHGVLPSGSGGMRKRLAIGTPAS